MLVSEQPTTFALKTDDESQNRVTVQHTHGEGQYMTIDKSKKELDEEVDRNSEDSFPASDPVSPFVPAVPVDEESTQKPTRHPDKNPDTK